MAGGLCYILLQKKNSTSRDTPPPLVCMETGGPQTPGPRVTQLGHHVTPMGQPSPIGGHAAGCPHPIGLRCSTWNTGPGHPIAWGYLPTPADTLIPYQAGLSHSRPYYPLPAAHSLPLSVRAPSRPIAWGYPFPSPDSRAPYRIRPTDSKPPPGRAAGGSPRGLIGSCMGTDVDRPFG